MDLTRVGYQYHLLSYARGVEIIPSGPQLEQSKRPWSLNVTLAGGVLTSARCEIATNNSIVALLVSREGRLEQFGAGARGRTPAFSWLTIRPDQDIQATPVGL